MPFVQVQELKSTHNLSASLLYDYPSDTCIYLWLRKGSFYYQNRPGAGSFHTYLRSRIQQISGSNYFAGSGVGLSRKPYTLLFLLKLGAILCGQSCFVLRTYMKGESKPMASQRAISILRVSIIELENHSPRFIIESS